MKAKSNLDRVLLLPERYAESLGQMIRFNDASIAGHEDIMEAAGELQREIWEGVKAATKVRMSSSFNFLNNPENIFLENSHTGLMGKAK